jgi:hypothetical protein
MTSLLGLFIGWQFASIDILDAVRRGDLTRGPWVRAALDVAATTALASLLTGTLKEARGCMERLHISAWELAALCWTVLAIGIVGVISFWRPARHAVQWILISQPVFLWLGAWVVVLSHPESWSSSRGRPPSEEERGEAFRTPSWREGFLARVADKILLEWDQPGTWAEVMARQGDAGYRELRAGILRTLPISAGLVAVQCWLVGRIPGGGGRLPLRTELVFLGVCLAYPVLIWCVLLLERTLPGSRVHVRLRIRGLEIGSGSARLRIPWARVDAFCFQEWQDLELLKLRLGNVIGQRVLAVALQPPLATQGALRPLLRQRGLFEEPLGEPYAEEPPL